MNIFAEFYDKWWWLIVVSTVACVAFLVMTVSQFIKCLYTKNTTSQSLFFVVILPITNTLITIYDFICFGIGIHDGNFLWSLLLPGVINGLVSAYGIMILKIKHRKAAKKLNLTEKEYYLKYLKPISLATKRQKKK